MKKSGVSNWTVSDFVGYYHLHKMKAKHPIPGTQVKLEREKRDYYELQRHKRNVWMAEHEVLSKKRGKIDEKARKHFEDVRKSYGMKFVWKNIEDRIMRKKGSLKVINTGSLFNDDADFGLPESVRLFFQECMARDFTGLKRLFLAGFDDLDHTVEPHGDTMLLLAAQRGDDVLVELLLQNGADANKQNRYGDVPLHRVWRRWIDNNKRGAHEDRSDLLRDVEKTIMALLSGEADPNMQRISSGNTALHQAAKYGQMKICKLLLSAGAHQGITNKEGKDAAQLANDSGFSELGNVISNWHHLGTELKTNEYLAEWQDFLNDRQQSIMQTVPAESIMQSLERTGRVRAANLVKRKTIEIYHPERNKIEKIVKVDKDGKPISLSEEAYLQRRGQHSKQQRVHLPSKRRLMIYDRQLEARRQSAEHHAMQRRATNLRNFGFLRNPALTRRRKIARLLVKDEHTLNRYDYASGDISLKRRKAVRDSEYAPRPSTTSNIFHRGIIRDKVVRPTSHQSIFDKLQDKVHVDAGTVPFVGNFGQYDTKSSQWISHRMEGALSVVTSRGNHHAGLFKTLASDKMDAIAQKLQKGHAMSSELRKGGKLEPLSTTSSSSLSSQAAAAGSKLSRGAAAAAISSTTSALHKQPIIRSGRINEENDSSSGRGGGTSDTSQRTSSSSSSASRHLFFKNRKYNRTNILPPARRTLRRSKLDAIAVSTKTPRSNTVGQVKGGEKNKKIIKMKKEKKEAEGGGGAAAAVPAMRLRARQFHKSFSRGSQSSVNIRAKPNNLSLEDPWKYPLNKDDDKGGLFGCFQL